MIFCVYSVNILCYQFLEYKRTSN